MCGCFDCCINVLMMLSVLLMCVVVVCWVLDYVGVSCWVWVLGCATVGCQIVCLG